MAAPKSEKYANLAATTLASDYTAADGQIVVASASGFPADGDFRVRLGDAGDETVTLFKVTSISGTTFTGAAEGTDSNIASGKAVTQVLTAGALDSFREDDCYSDTYANRMASEKAGRLFLPSDGAVLERDTGVVWAPWGPLFPCTPPPAVSSLTWQDQGSATADETRGGIYLSCPGGGTGGGGLIAAAPATPWTFTVGCIFNVADDNYAGFGLGFRQSSDGKSAIMSVGWSTSGYVAISSNKNSAWNTYAASYGTYAYIDSMLAGGPLKFFRIADDGTYRRMYISADGITFTLLHSVGRTDYMTANQYGVQIGPGANHATSMWILHWVVA